MMTTSTAQTRKYIKTKGEVDIFVLFTLYWLFIWRMCRKIHFLFLFCFSVNCDAGNYFNNTMGGCQPCGIGFYQKHAGQDFCHQCPMGQVTKLDNSTTCDDCFCEYHIYIYLSIYLSYNKMSPGHLTTTNLTPFIHHSDYLYPAQRRCWGVYWFHSVRPSVRPSRVCPASVPHHMSAL